MSETDDLKKGAAESRAWQVGEAVNKYLARLVENTDVAVKRKRDSMIIYTVGWLAWCVSGFFGINTEYWFLMIFMGVFIYDAFRSAKCERAFGEFEGAIEILRLLGYIDLPDPRDRKRSGIFEEGAAMVKRWTSEKKAAQEKVYAPA